MHCPVPNPVQTCLSQWHSPKGAGLFHSCLLGASLTWWRSATFWTQQPCNSPMYFPLNHCSCRCAFGFPHKDNNPCHGTTAGAGVGLCRWGFLPNFYRTLDFPPKPNQNKQESHSGREHKDTDLRIYLLTGFTCSPAATTQGRIELSEDMRGTCNVSKPQN